MSNGPIALIGLDYYETVARIPPACAAPSSTISGAKAASPCPAARWADAGSIWPARAGPGSRTPQPARPAMSAGPGAGWISWSAGEAYGRWVNRVGWPAGVAALLARVAAAQGSRRVLPAGPGKAAGLGPISRARPAGLASPVGHDAAVDRTRPSWVTLSGTTCAAGPDLPGEFTPDTRDDVTGWLWEGAAASLIGEAIPRGGHVGPPVGGRLSPSVAALPGRHALRVTAQAGRKAARRCSGSRRGWAIPDRQILAGRRPESAHRRAAGSRSVVTTPAAP